MIQKLRALRLAFLLVGIVWAGAAQAQFLLSNPTTGAPTGGQLQIGTGLPLPVGTAGIFTGGTASMGPNPFPPLFVPAATNVTPVGQTRTIMQTLGTGQGGAITFPPAVLSYNADGTPDYIGVFNTNPVVFQVATTLSYAWPSTTATLAPGSGPGPAVLTGPAGGLITYSGGSKSFGGPAQFALAAGPGAGTFSIPPSGTMASMIPIATVWINGGGATPGMAAVAVIVGASNPLGVAAQGAPGATTGTTSIGAAPMGFKTVNAPAGTIMGCTMWCLGPNGTVPLTSMGSTWSHGPGGAGPGLTNMVTGSKGFPWTTGFVTISAMGAAPPEVFYASGTDMRVSGVGNIQLVSGSLSQRMLSGPNANRGWLSLNLVPEPSAALGALGALGMLVVCHGLVRRRSR